MLPKKKKIKEHKAAKMWRKAAREMNDDDANVKPPKSAIPSPMTMAFLPKSKKGRGDKAAQRRRAREQMNKGNANLEPLKPVLLPWPTWTTTDPENKLRNLKTKLRDIEALEAKLNNGEVNDPEPELWLKVAKRRLVEKEIGTLEKVIL